MWLFLLPGLSLAQDMVLVGVQDPAVPPVAAVEALGGEILRCYHSSRVCLLRGVDPERLVGLPGVRYAERDRPMQVLASGVEAGPTAQCPDPWEHTFIGTDAAWEQVCGADGPVLAIEDSGFRLDHVELQGRIVGGYDYGDGDDTPEVSLLAGVPEHGTFVAGLVAANAGSFGRTGIAPEGSLFLQKIADGYGALYFSYAIEAMDDLALNHPEVSVLNYSIAATDAPQAFLDAVEGLLAADILLVAAAANCGSPSCLDANNDDYPVYPASYDLPHIVSVASLMSDGSLDPMSHYGPSSVTLAAPGADLCSLGISSDGALMTSSGTSFATPVAAGAALLLREAYPRLTAPHTALVLERSCAPSAALVDRVRCGGGLSIERALATPVVAFESLIDPLNEVISLSLDSRAAGGSLLVVLEHPGWLEIDHSEAVPFEEGDILPFPLSVPAEESGSWLVVDIPSDELFEIDLLTEILEDGEGDISVSLHPYAGDLVGVGPDDSTFSFHGTVTLPDELPGPGPDHKTREAGGCGCQSAPAAPSLLLVLASLAWIGARYQRPEI